MHVTAIIPAGGTSTRYKRNKLLTIIHGQPVIMHCLQAFISHPNISDIIIPCHESTQSSISSLIPNSIQFVQGGRTRSESVRNGVYACSKNTTHVLIHDAARPAIHAPFIDSILDAGAIHEAVIPGIPVTDTIKHVQNHTVQATIDRSTLRSIQTPQLFTRECLEKAYNQMKDIQSYTDESSLVEACGTPVHVIDGCQTNIKLTYPHQTVELTEILKNI